MNVSLTPEFESFVDDKVKRILRAMISTGTMDRRDSERPAASVVGEREDAMVFALALMTPDRAFDAVTAAERSGLAILGLAHAPSR